MTTSVLEEAVRPAPGGSNTDGFQTPVTTRSSDPAPSHRTAEHQPRPVAQAKPPHHRRPAPQRRRYHEVDLLRFVAAIAVVGFHYFFRASVQDPAFAHTGFSDPGGVFRYGYLGVDLFFVISGFVILNSAWQKRPSAFVASRIGRLYPAFWVAVTLTALVLAMDPNHRFTVTVSQYLVNLTMAPKLFDVGQIDGVYWTLLVELKFYLLVLGLCMLGMTLKRVLGFAVGWLAISIWHAFVPLTSALKQLLVPEWAPYFVAGILFALIAREGWQKRYAIPLVVASGWSVYLAIGFAARASDLHDAPLSPYVVAGVVGGVFVLFALIASHKLQARWAAKVAFLGGLTYPVYLLHENIGFVLFELGHGRVNRWLLLAGVLAVVVTAAWLLHVLVENRFAAPFARLLRTRWEAVARVALDRGPLHDATGRQWTPPSMSAPAWGTARIF